MGHIAPIHRTKKYEKLPKSDISHIDSYRFVAIFPQIALLYVRHDCLKHEKPPQAAWKRKIKDCCMQQNRAATMLPPHTGVARFMDACHHRQPDATPVWFMRQAGRSLAAYRALRQRYDMLTMVKTPELATEVTLMPITSLGVDAAVVYSDIMLPLEDMGIPFEIQHEVGPVIHHPLRTMQDIEALRVPERLDIARCMMETIRLVRHELEGKQAVIGFAGAPFTLACYLIEGRPSRDYRYAKAMMYSQP